MQPNIIGKRSLRIVNSKRIFDLITGQELFIFCTANEGDGVSITERIAPENDQVDCTFPGAIY
jgi:hypothetical protein